MTFPVVEDISSAGATSATLNVPYPDAIAAGDLLVAIAGANSSVLPSFPGGWSVVSSGTSGSHALAVAYVVADGSESGTFPVTRTGFGRLEVICYRVSGTDGHAEGATPAAGTSNAPSPPSLSPSWGADDTLWLAPLYKLGASDSSPTPPSGFGDLQSSGVGSASSLIIHSAQENNATGSYDPGDWSIPTSRIWIATTIAIQPEGDGSVPLEAGVASTSEASGTASVARGVAGSAASASFVGGNAAIAKSLSGVASSRSSVSGSLAAVSLFAAVVASRSSILASAGVSRSFGASASSHSSVTGTLNRPTYVFAHLAGGDLPSGLYDIEITREDGVTTLSGVEITSGAYALPAEGSPLLEVVLTPLFDRPEATGTRKCYNTRATCQDPENYEPQDLVLRFCRPMAVLPKELGRVIPSVEEVAMTPTRLNIGAGSRASGPLGTRAVATVTFRDHPSPDRDVDPYVAERGFDPLSRGTFWTKWLARNPYHQNRRLVIRSGCVGQSLDEMVRRDYLVDRIEGPTSDGTVQLVAKDALKLAEDERAQAPVLSPGELTAAIDEGATAFSVAPASADDYPASGTLRIGREVMTYAGRSEADGVVTFTGVARGTDGTGAAAHQGSERVQLCLRFTNEPVATLLHTLLTAYGNVPEALIDLQAWNTEAARWLQGFELSALISEPTGVTKLIAEIVEQVPLVIWWDERERLIRLRADRRSETQPPLIDERDHIVAGTMAVREDPAQRASQVWVYWALRDPTGSVGEEANYSRIRIRADVEAEGADQYGEQRIRKVFARWLATEAQATVLSRRLLQRYGRNPRFLSLSLDARDREIWTASFVTAATRLVTDDTGAPLPELYQVLSSEETIHGHMVEYELEKAAFEAGVRGGFWMANEAPNLAEASAEQRERGMFWAGEDGRLGDGSNGYGWQ